MPKSLLFTGAGLQTYGLVENGKTMSKYVCLHQPVKIFADRQYFVKIRINIWAYLFGHQTVKHFICFLNLFKIGVKLWAWVVFRKIFFTFAFANFGRKKKLWAYICLHQSVQIVRIVFSSEQSYEHRIWFASSFEDMILIWFCFLEHVEHQAV